MNEDDEVQAKLRFFIISFVRLMGALLLAFGLAIISRGYMYIPKPAGYAFVAMGFFELIVLPVILSKKWKSPRDL